MLKATGRANTIVLFKVLNADLAAMMGKGKKENYIDTDSSSDNGSDSYDESEEDLVRRKRRLRTRSRGRRLMTRSAPRLL